MFGGNFDIVDSVNRLGVVELVWLLFIFVKNLLLFVFIYRFVFF